VVWVCSDEEGLGGGGFKSRTPGMETSQAVVVQQQSSMVMAPARFMNCGVQ